MGLLALKLLLAPSFVVGVSVTARRYGPVVGGLLGGLPVVCGPILLVIALTHERSFAADAATASVLGLVSLTAFVVVYAWLARRLRWVALLPLGWVVFLAVTGVLSVVGGVTPAVALAAAFASFALALAVVPEPAPEPVLRRAPPGDLPMRAAAAAAMVVALTAAASSLGPHLSGLLAPFPIITSVLAAFTHAQHGPATTVILLRGMLRGFFVFALCCFAFALALGA